MVRCLKRCSPIMPTSRSRIPKTPSHVLKYEPRDRSQVTPVEAMTTYSADDTHLDPEVVETITGWLHARV